ncbi:imidazolonepropionase domain protein, partial [Parabacteroides johnsonii DSM 18315]
SIMERGGGIVNTMNATRSTSYDDLFGDAYDRLDTMMDMGVTTVEGKSGYGLDLATELIQLRVMKELNMTIRWMWYPPSWGLMPFLLNLPGVRMRMSTT